MLRKLLALCATSVLSTAALAAPAYYNLGSGNYGSGVSANGSVVSGYGGAGFFYWTPGGGVVDIGGHSPALGDGVGGSSAISEDGTYLGGNTDDTNTLSQMSRYHIPTSSWQLLGGIGSSSGVEGSSAWGMSGNGQSVVGLGWVNAGTAHAIQWTSPGPTQDMGSTVAGQSTRANAANFDGSIVVGWQDASDGFRQGAIWNNGVQTILFNNTDPVSEASDVSSDGNWVVGQGGFGTADQPWRYNRSSGQLDLLGILDPNAFFPSRGATAVRDDGQVVVGFERDFFNPFGGTFGTIWIEGQGIQDLTTFALAAGVPLPAGVALNIPLAISGDGSTIAGIDNMFNGFVITIPEPGTIAMLAPLALMAIRRRRD